MPFNAARRVSRDILWECSLQSRRDRRRNGGRPAVYAYVCVYVCPRVSMFGSVHRASSGLRHHQLIHLPARPNPLGNGLLPRVTVEVFAATPPFFPLDVIVPPKRLCSVGQAVVDTKKR